MLTKVLPVHLTKEEVAAKASELATKIQDHKFLADEAKGAAASYKKRLDRIAEEIDGLGAMVRDRIEYRSVNCVENRNDMELTIDVIRVDTGERVQVRAMTEVERQLRMFPREVGHEEDAPAVAEGEKSVGQ